METAKFPWAEFVPREALGLPSSLPGEGSAEFKLVGDMTIHGVTSELTWDVIARFTGDEIVGEATTSFPFSQFGLEVPRVMEVLSVEDNIQLQIDFRFRREG